MVNFYVNRIKKGYIHYYSEVALTWRAQVKEVCEGQGIHIPDSPEGE